MAYHHGSLPDSLVSVTRRLLRTRPATELSIREVARVVGVSPNAPYRHFPDREALLAAVAAAGYRALAERLTGRTGRTAVAEVWSELGQEEPALVELMSAPTRPAGSVPLADAVAEWLGEVTRAIEPEVDGDDPEELIRNAVTCWASLVGLTRLGRSGLLASLDDWMLPEARVVLALVAPRRR